MCLGMCQGSCQNGSGRFGSIVFHERKVVHLAFNVEHRSVRVPRARYLPMGCITEKADLDVWVLRGQPKGCPIWAQRRTRCKLGMAGGFRCRGFDP